MPTSYPVTLPTVPNDPETVWRAKRVSDTFIRRPDEGWPSATTWFSIDASSSEEAELRLLAWIDHSFQDDLRRSTATAFGEEQPGHWWVSLQVFGEF
ncbi:hypothetical protein [Streptomyces sp. NPDC058595]|uniref:hypothetical protein n=1 Tax=Streptomyces sp. NPDC058595 TaxID=3346550 RepID=UPI00365E7A32